MEIKLNIWVNDSCSPNGINADREGKQRHKASKHED